MKRTFLLLLLAFCAGNLAAQTATDSIPKLDPKIKAALNAADQTAYQAAIRYSDLEMAKTKLYDLMIRNPENPRYMEALGNIYFDNSQFASAALVSLDLLQGNSKNVGALEIAAYSLEQLGALDRALPHFESLYLLTGDNFSLYKSAFLQYNLKRYEEAMNSVNMLVKNSKADEKIGFPKSQTETQEVSMKAAALNLKGLIYLDQNSKVEAKTAFNEAIALDANFVQAKENLKKTN
ncbi:lipopolysaccharide assembly protein LapB [Algoriphagus sp.]|jgi:predicted Zn-dependent protease|uniref:tetratricopeptide repeat protein n=1 Tax=Algoriphagus sp. TaxID=1872435 RepID=UPI0027186C6C|nr:CDC27 family protein [Algoriphagus sp.]MDO8968720.1 CDC27 family protein [Algoriphagus sp.]MDP3199362.1 CDC27 family protein [Algoriphagus sp.]